MSQTFTSFHDFKQRYPIRPNDKGALLGSGSYGRVIKVEDQLETEWVAIKISEFKGNDTKSLKAEVELAQRVPRQANIARYDACHRLETDTSVSDFAIMKYYPDGNLADLLRHEALTEAQIYDITRGILLGLQHLHRHRIVHRDFKPANILISRDNSGRFIPKIADFGLSKLVSDDELDSSDFDLSDGRGTPSYKAPEQIEGSRVSFNLDLWAFGVILYEMLTGEKPFHADLPNGSEQSIRREIEKKIMTVELPSRIDQLAEPYGAIIRRCLVRDIHQRVRKEAELLDLLDRIPQLLVEAKIELDNWNYEQARSLFEQILVNRADHAEAQNGLVECQIAMALRKADTFASTQQFEQAKRQYEQIVRLKPTHPAAIRGLALCLERLRPAFVPVAEPDATDLYQAEKTDVYIAPVEPAMSVSNIIETIVGKTSSKDIFPKDEPVENSKPGKPVVTHPLPTFSWRVVAPVVVCLGAVVLYFSRNTSQLHTVVPQKEPIQTAAGMPHDEHTDRAPFPRETVRLTLSPSNTKETLTKRIDIALAKARRAYEGKDYETTLMLTNSALHLDPTRRDVIALRNAALNVMPPKSREETNTVSAIPASEAPKVTGSAPKTDRPAEPSAMENPKNEKPKVQGDYDQLIEDGIKAIANGNNKAKAIEVFSKAHSLAEEYKLSTAKADEAYITYITKANKIFDNEEFEGARGWYKVAQALKDTPEVRTRIKQCTNNL